MPRPDSPCRSTATSTAASPTRPSRASRSASPRLEGGLGAVATAIRTRAPQFITFASLAGAGDHIVSSASLYGGSVTQLDVTLRRFGVDTTFVHRHRPRRLRRGDHGSDQADLRRVDHQPVRRDRRPGRARRGRARAPPAAHRRLDRRDPVPQPPDRVGRRRRHPLGHEVPRRSRHDPRRRRRRSRAASTGRTSASRCSTSRGAALRRTQLARQLRRVRLPHPPARRAAARHRPGARAALGLPARAGCRDPSVPDAGARRQRTHGRRVAGRRRPDRVRELGRSASRTRTTSGRSVLPEGSGRRLQLRRRGRTLGRPAVHRDRSTWPATSPTSATRRRSSSIRHRRPTPSSASSSCSTPACCPGSCASASGSRTSTTSSTTSTKRSLPR